MNDETIRKLEQLGVKAMEYANLAGLAAKNYAEAMELFSAAAIKNDETQMEAQRLAAHSAVDALCDNRFLIQKCSDDQRALMNKFL